MSSGTGQQLRFTIRPVEPDDTEAVLRLCANGRVRTYLPLLPTEHHEEFLRSQEITEDRVNDTKLKFSQPKPGSIRIVAVIGGKIIGYHGAKTTEGILHLTGLFVDEAYQGEGVGKELMHAVLEKGVGMTISLKVLEANTHATSYYYRLGFHVLPGGDDEYHGAKRVTMIREL